MKFHSLKSLVPWSLSGTTPFFNKYGDRILFGAVMRTPPIRCNPDSDTGIHSAVPHKFVYAYLVAIKSLLRFCSDLAVHVHDDGTLSSTDKALIGKHVPGVCIVDRAAADSQFDVMVADEFLSRVRRSYTSYLKLFDPTLYGGHKRIIIVDTDVLFLREPTEVLQWVRSGGAPWFHQSESWRDVKSGPPTQAGQAVDSHVLSGAAHIQTRVVQSLEQINKSLGSNFEFVPGFNSGFVGYERGVVNYAELKDLLSHLYSLFGEAIFRWGSEQTMHGLVLCGKGARALPQDKYMVYTDLNSERADSASFVHFIGEYRFNGFNYPRLASGVIRGLRG